MIDKDLIDKAESGDVDALVSLGVAYYNEEDGKENQGKAFELFSKALEIAPNNVKAINNIANCYNNGVGVDENKQKAMELYREAAETGYANSQYNLANELRRQENPECLEWYQKAFENGDVDAPYEIARIYYNGKIVPKDCEKYIEYLTKADEIGNNYATFDLAYSYLTGDCVETNKEKGAALMEKAANAGSSDAAINMALVYKKGDGVVADIEKAVEWAEKAAERGDDSMLVRILSETDPQKAFEYNLEHAQKGDVKAQYRVFEAYAEGAGVNRDIKEALDWLRRAADAGDTTSQAIMGSQEMTFGDAPSAVRYWEKASAGGNLVSTNDLAKVYFSGASGVPADKPRAIELFKKAAEGGFGEAQAALGKCYSTGNGVPKNANEAFRLFSLAAEQGVAIAQKDLAVCYKYGLGTPENDALAAQWFEKAAENGNDKAKICLAEIYAKGEGVAIDRNKAETIYKEIIAKGESNDCDDAVFGLAQMYFDNPDERGKAFPFWQRLASRGNAEAKYNLGLCYFEGEGTEEDDSQAFFWWCHAAEEGVAKAYMSLAACYQYGLGTPENGALAVQWFEKAAESGNFKAKLCLADIYANRSGKDEGVSPDYHKAETLYNEVIACGESDNYENALFGLSLLYYNKLNDYDRAFPLCQQLASRGNTTAKYNLGLDYFCGQGTAKNDDQALFWWRQAAAEGDVDAQDKVRRLEEIRRMEEAQRNGGNQNINNRNTNAAAPQKSGGCYVATAVYGSYDCPEVWTLRRYRDYTLAETRRGKAFIKAYYSISPTLVRWFGKTAWFKKLWRGKLDRMVKKLQDSGVENTPYEDKQF